MAGVLFSGGQDSATCLAWALERYAYVETIGFTYGQRHDIEMECRLTVRDNIVRAFPHWHTQLMHRSKAGAWEMAHQLGGDALIEIILEDSHSCYMGERGARQDWGYGCAACPACELRANGWTEYIS